MADLPVQIHSLMPDALFRQIVKRYGDYIGALACFWMALPASWQV
jgi:hypothetical protein